jgi:hypothetical protein
MSLTAAYFVGEITIPNISGSSVTETANLNTLNILIAKYEPEFMKWLLGEDFYNDYAAGLAEVSPETRWTDLRDKIFVENETLDVGFSPAANYIYCKWIKNNHSLTAINAEILPQSENSTRTTYREKYVAAWNEMVRMAIEIQDWLTYGVPDDYPEMDIDELGVFETINTFGI